MSADSPAPQSHALIFRWPERSASFVLPSLFLVSVAVHALAFYVFQVSYPLVSTAPSPAQVTLLTPSSPANQALLSWASARDPAAAQALQEVTPPGLGDVQYTPSYAKAQSLPKPAEPSGAAVPFPPAHEPLALLAPGAAPVAAVHAPVRTSVAFSDSLRERVVTPQPNLLITGKSTTSLEPATFLVAIGADGAVRYSFLQETCGNSEIDKEAEGQLQTRRFQPAAANSPLVWGFATFTWGADAFVPAPPPANSPSTENSQ